MLYRQQADRAYVEIERERLNGDQPSINRSRHKLNTDISVEVIAKAYSRSRTSLQSVLTSNNRSQQETATRPLVNVDRLRLDGRIEKIDR